MVCVSNIVIVHETQKPKQGGGGILKLKGQSAKISDNFHFQGGRGILKLKSQSAKISDNFLFFGGGYSEFQNRGIL